MASSIETRLAEAERRLAARYGLDVTDRFVDVARPPMRLRVREIGSGPAVLFLHGVSLTSDHWMPLLPHLASFRCLLVDLPGHGRSDRMDFRGVPVRRWYDTLLGSLLDALGLERAPIVGHSLGGMLAMWLALDAPERVPAIVAAGTPAVAFPGTRGDLLLGMLATPGLGHLALAFPTPLPLYRVFLAQSAGFHALRVSPPEVFETSHLASRLPGAARSTSSWLPRVMRGRGAQPEHVMSREELGRLQQPVLFLWGDRDTFCPPERLREAVAAMPNARLEMLPGGHEVWLDEPERSGKLASAFLAEATGTQNANAARRADA
jgi:pimeloyl-ACP methyl ester carboxylesterase